MDFLKCQTVTVPRQSRGFSQDNNRVKRIAVETGQRQRGKVEIRQGLQAGATVVVGGIQKIQDGQLVKPLQADQDDKSGQHSPKSRG